MLRTLSLNSTESLARIVARNASANLGRLVGSGIIALFLPAFLVRTLPRDVYGTWALLLQLTLYVGYFDFGIQTAVSRFVAHATELNDVSQRDSIISTAIVLLSGMAVLATGLITALAIHIPQLFHQMPASLDLPAKYALLVMGTSFAIGLPFSAINAYFIGIQRSEIPALVVVCARLATALLIVGAVLRGGGLIAIGAAVALANLLSYLATCGGWRLWARQVRFRLATVSRACIRQIGGYSVTLSVWLLAGLMISGLDLTIVGMFDYNATAYYALAATLTNFLVQTHSAVFAALLPASAMLGARGDADRLGRMLVASTRYGMLIILAMSVPLLFAGQSFIRVWAGGSYAIHTIAILRVLVVANAIRLCALPYSTLLLGTGQQVKVLASPVAEGITNLVASLVGAHYLGAIGVAIGTLIGSVISVGFHFLYNMPRTALMLIDRRRLLSDALIRPLLCAMPFVVVWLSRVFALHFPEQVEASLIGAAAIGSGVLVWHYGLISSERQRLLQAIRVL